MQHHVAVMMIHLLTWKDVCHIQLVLKAHFWKHMQPDAIFCEKSSIHISHSHRLENCNLSVQNGASLIAQLVKNPYAMQETPVQLLVLEESLEKGFLGLPWGSTGKESSCNAGNLSKESACNAGDLGLIPGLGRSPEKGNSYPLQYSGLENSMDCIVHGVSKSWTGLSNFHFHFVQGSSIC